MEPTEDQIVEYLRANPQFFERQAALLTELYLPSPHGGGTVSLAERQQLAQRDKIRVLEAKLSELLQFGEENDVIGEKVHRLCLALMATRSFEAVAQTVTHGLQENFRVPHVAIRTWAAPQQKADADHAEFSPVSEETRRWAEAQHAPYCGHHPTLDMQGWFGEPHAPLTSFAITVLRGEQAFGVLAMASEDAQRFYPEMGTLYLKRIGEIISVALLRYLI